MTNKVEMIKVDQLATFSADKYNRVAISGAKGLLRLLCFESGQRVLLHAHPQGDEYFLAVKGKVKVRIGNEETSAEPIIRGMHIHPALSEVVETAFCPLMPPEHINTSLSTTMVYLPSPKNID